MGGVTWLPKTILYIFIFGLGDERTYQKPLQMGVRIFLINPYFLTSMVVLRPKTLVKNLARKSTRLAFSFHLKN